MKALFLMLVILCVLPFGAQAQQRVNDGLAEFYQPVSAMELGVRLPPRRPDDQGYGGYENNSGFFGSGGGSGRGCPDQIQIGSIDSDTPVYGGVDIDVVITKDIIINCGGFR